MPSPDVTTLPRSNSAIKCFVQVVIFAGQCGLIDIYLTFAQNSIRRDALSCLQQNQITAHDIIRGNDNDAASVAPHTTGHVGGFCLHPAKRRIAARILTGRI